MNKPHSELDHFEACITTWHFVFVGSNRPYYILIIMKFTLDLGSLPMNNANKTYL
jgi:hypothetical protein